jgi:Tol biopolymer transport system component
MELVEGEDLAQRLQRGRVPVEEALRIAHQLTVGLEAAHDKGIVHRDLKPANVKVTPSGEVKVLDFGLAKAFAEEGQAAGDPSRSPTLTAAATRAGVILGTAAYMSPEQARGSSVDRRADIWAFGCVLYEMLTGRRLFTGETVSDTLAAVLKSEPDWSSLPEATTARVTGLVKRCLRKDPRERLRDIGDARLELAEELSGAPDATATTPGKASRRLAGWIWAVAGLLAGALAAIAGLRQIAPVPPAAELRKLSISVPQLGTGWFHAARISPDGHLIAYLRSGRLWIRDLRRFDATEIPGSDGAHSPFWSADSTRIAFARDNKLWTWAVVGGQSTSICSIPASGSSNGGAWGKDGKIHFVIYRGGLYEVAEAGGDARLILSPDSNEVDFHYPHLLPDGRRLVMVAHRKEGPQPVIVALLPDGTRTNLKEYDGLGDVSYSPTGHLLLNFPTRRPKVLAVPFSESKLEITGEPFQVASGGEFPSVSATGLLLYSMGSSSVQSELVWVDREGRTGQIVGRPRLGLDSPAISPDGTQVAVVAYENENADIWIQNLARGTWSRLVAGPMDEVSPIWSPSGDRVYYLQESKSWFSSLMEVPSDGTRAPRSRAEHVEVPPIAASPDGRTVVFAMEEQGHMGLYSVDLESGAGPVRITPDKSFSEAQPAISRDGRWLAYTSNESGSDEVFVRLYPGGGQKQQVSLGGGQYPFWSRKGDALFYWEGAVLIEVPVQAGSALTLGTARKLFSAASLGLEQTLDIASDGRFLVVRRSSEDPRRGLLLVENWLEEFRTR